MHLVKNMYAEFDGQVVKLELLREAAERTHELTGILLFADKRECAVIAISEIFCPCAPSPNTCMSPGGCRFANAIAHEILRLEVNVNDATEGELTHSTRIGPGEKDSVEIASEDSFPASDPPSWIARRLARNI